MATSLRSLARLCGPHDRRVWMSQTELGAELRYILVSLRRQRRFAALARMRRPSLAYHVLRQAAIQAQRDLESLVELVEQLRP